MARANGYGSLEYEIVKLREEQKRILDVLKMLFDLLEQYAPRWYTEEYHERALSALQLSTDECLSRTCSLSCR
jgi:hypothetical protein